MELSACEVHATCWKGSRTSRGTPSPIPGFRVQFIVFFGDLSRQFLCCFIIWTFVIATPICGSALSNRSRVRSLNLCIEARIRRRSNSLEEDRKRIRIWRNGRPYTRFYRECWIHDASDISSDCFNRAHSQQFSNACGRIWLMCRNNWICMRNPTTLSPKSHLSMDWTDFKISSTDKRNGDRYVFYNDAWSSGNIILWVDALCRGTED